MGPRQPMDAPNLTSSRTHPQAITSQLSKEVDAGRIHSPFTQRPLLSLHCSGLGIVTKKGNKWRMILHLYTRTGSSINNHISRDDFSLRYSTIDDAVRMLTALGPGALMAKTDLKSAFRMIPGLGTPWHAVAGPLLLRYLLTVWPALRTLLV